MTSETVTESTPIPDSTVDYFVEVYRAGQVYNADHRVLVGLLGEYYGLWSSWGDFVESVCNAMGVTTPPASNVSSMKTLYRTLIPGYWATTEATDNDELLTVVDGVVNGIFGDGPVEWATLRRLVSADGALNRAVQSDEAFPVVDYLRQGIAKVGEHRNSRDYFGNQTNALVGAIEDTDYAGRLTPKGRTNAAKYGDPVDRVEIETDPDAGIWKAIRTVERVMAGERKCDKVAYFAQQLEDLSALAEAWLTEFHATANVDEEATV